MGKRIATEDDDRQELERHASRARHQKRHQRDLGNIKLHIAHDALESLVRNGDVGEFERRKRRYQLTTPQRVRVWMVPEQRPQRCARRDGVR
jgi:hypothetical protein